mgnify:FL=1
MSKLLDLFNSSDYARLNNLPANNGSNRTFSVRNQSNAAPEIRQGNAVNFIDPLNKTQNEFTVDEASNTLSTTGVAKDVNADYTTYTKDALGTYATRAVDPKLSQYRSKLVQKYLATDSNSQYVTKNSTSAGVELGYTPA